MSEQRRPPGGVPELVEAINRLWAALARRRRVFLVVFLTTFLLVHAYGFFWPGTFAAKAAILVQKTRFSPRLDATPQKPTTITAAEVTEEEVGSEIAVLTSREVLAAVVESTGLDRVAPPWYLRALFYPLRIYERLYSRYHGVPRPTSRDRAIESVARQISIERLKDSNILVLSFEAKAPEVAEIVLDQIVQHYLDHHLEVHRPRDVELFFERQATILEQDLVSHEDELQALKEGVGAADVEAERDIQLEIDAGLRKEQAALSRRLAELDGRIAGLESTLAEAADPTAGADAPLSDPTLQRLKEEVLRLELERIRLETRYQPDFPLVSENQEQLEAARRALEDARRNVFEHSPTLLAVDRELASVSAERLGAQRRQRILETQLEASRARLWELDRQALETTRIQRRIRSAEEIYMMYLARFEEARIDTALDQRRFSNVAVVQRAAASPKPVRPKKLMVLLASLGGGLLAAFFTCVGLELKALGLAATLDSLTPPPAGGAEDGDPDS